MSFLTNRKVYGEYARDLNLEIPDKVLYKYNCFLDKKYFRFKKRKELINSKMDALRLIYKNKMSFKKASELLGISTNYLYCINRYFLLITGYRFLNGIWRLDRKEEVK